MTINYQSGDIDAHGAAIRPRWRCSRSARRFSPTCLPLANFGADARDDTSSTPSCSANFR
jgi:hypothetical protein